LSLFYLLGLSLFYLLGLSLFYLLDPARECVWPAINDARPRAIYNAFSAFTTRFICSTGGPLTQIAIKKAARNRTA
jgi:hypothetical protein